LVADPLGDAIANRFYIRDFYVFLQDKSSSSILTKEFRKSNIPELPFGTRILTRGKTVKVPPSQY